MGKLELILLIWPFFQLAAIGGLLQLSLNCLSFDFIGSLADETNDDNATVQVPTLWRLCKHLHFKVRRRMAVLALREKVLNF